MPAQQGAHAVRFGSFELNLASGELARNGRKIHLPDQAIQILLMLLERPGEVVTREQIQARLWPSGTVVEFDHGINSSIRRLRAALDDSAEQPRYVETLAKRGYRFIFPCEVEPAESVVPERRRPHKWLWGVVAAFVIALAAAGSIYLSGRLHVANAAPITSIAVLPLVNATQDSNAEYLSDGISEEIINRLSAAPHLKVIARTSAFRFRGKDVDVQKAGHDLGVGAILTGTLTKRGDSVIVQTDLVDASNGSELWGEQYKRSMGDLQNVQAEIATEIAEKLRLRLSDDDQKRLTKRFTENPEAYDLYLKSAHASNDSEFASYLHQAIAKDPNFALAYVGLAQYYDGQGLSRKLAAEEAFTKEKSAAIKALEIDDNLGEAHVSLGQALLGLWDWRGAEREFKRGIELNANGSHASYSWYLMRVGNTQEGLAEAHRAEEVDPLSSHGFMVIIYGIARQYDRAVEEARLANCESVQASLALSLAQMGRLDESIEMLKPFADAAGQGHRGYAYARSGRMIEAQSILSDMKKRSQTQGVGAYEAAFIYAALGKKDEAFEWLDRAYDQHDPGLTYLKVDPVLDPLRSDPRFGKLVRRVGLPT
jgi:TolB-like protein/DNA-binding winged helix-turn-helix (wHTH) protein